MISQWVFEIGVWFLHIFITFIDFKITFCNIRSQDACLLISRGWHLAPPPRIFDPPKYVGFKRVNHRIILSKYKETFSNKWGYQWRGYDWLKQDFSQKWSAWKDFEVWIKTLVLSIKDRVNCHVEVGEIEINWRLTENYLTSCNSLLLFPWQQHLHVNVNLRFECTRTLLM